MYQRCPASHCSPWYSASGGGVNLGHCLSSCSAGKRNIVQPRGLAWIISYGINACSPNYRLARQIQELCTESPNTVRWSKQIGPFQHRGRRPWSASSSGSDMCTPTTSPFTESESASRMVVRRSKTRIVVTQSEIVASSLGPITLQLHPFTWPIYPIRPYPSCHQSLSYTHGA